ncbi:MAG: hypothetical protein GH155_04905 [Spirochaeta sp.]|nr:hypothetical protein [Spirochaeta sp.]
MSAMNSRRKERHRQSAGSSITTGLVFTLAFGLAWGVTGIWAFIFPMFFAGVLPLAEGVRRSLLYRQRDKIAPRDDEAVGEKQVLQAAKAEKGLITPALVALKTDLTMEKAEKILESMAQKGYAVMHVDDHGRIEFEFPEFIPRLEG